MDCVDMIKSSNVKKSIFHCFGGSSDLVKEICDNNYYFSIPTNIAKSKQIKKIVKNVPLSQLFTETDSPYLGPFSGKRNEPANITETIKVIAKIKGMDEKEVVNNIYMNYQRVF